VKERIGIRAAVEDKLSSGRRLEQRTQPTLLKGGLLQPIDIDEHGGTAIVGSELRKEHLAITAQVDTLKIDSYAGRLAQTIAVLAAQGDRIDEHRPRPITSTANYRSQRRLKRHGCLWHPMHNLANDEAIRMRKRARTSAPVAPVGALETDTASHIARRHLARVAHVGSSVKLNPCALLERVAIVDLRSVHKYLPSAFSPFNEAPSQVAAIIAALPHDDDAIF
jgi:hypothetical protein